MAAKSIHLPVIVLIQIRFGCLVEFPAIIVELKKILRRGDSALCPILAHLLGDINETDLTKPL